MNNIAITGANGFLGWHTRCALAEKGAITNSFIVGNNYSKSRAVNALENTTSLIHIAGINRGKDSEVYEGNVLFAEQARTALLECKNPPETIIFANSIQSTNGSSYGNSKQIAAAILEKTALEIGINFKNVLIPNVFGEHGKPFYNAVTSTFCHQIANGLSPEVNVNSALNLVHAQDVADCLIQAISDSELSLLSVDIDVENLLEKLLQIAEIYNDGDIPDLSERFTHNLFNTYRSYLIPDKIGIPLQRRSDIRGSFFEIIRYKGGQGQFSFSTTGPNIIRGEHFHRRKVERFTVISGEATINIRKMYSEDVLSFRVNGEQPYSIDMPTMWTHNIHNVGEEPLFTAFWINEIFDSSSPDTTYEKVIHA